METRYNGSFWYMYICGLGEVPHARTLTLYRNGYAGAKYGNETWGRSLHILGYMYTITEEVLHASTASKGCEDNHISLAKDGLLFPFLDSLPVLVPLISPFTAQQCQYP